MAGTRQLQADDQEAPTWSEQQAASQLHYPRDGCLRQLPLAAGFQGIRPGLGRELPQGPIGRNCRDRWREPMAVVGVNAGWSKPRELAHDARRTGGLSGRLPQVTLRKRTARARLQVALELGCAGCIRERDCRNTAPRPSGRCVDRVTAVVGGKPGVDVRGDARVEPPRLRLASQDVDASLVRTHGRQVRKDRAPVDLPETSSALKRHS